MKAHLGEDDSALERNEALIHASTWMSCEDKSSRLGLLQESPWQPVIRIQGFHCGGLGFNPWSGN